MKLTKSYYQIIQNDVTYGHSLYLHPILDSIFKNMDISESDNLIISIYNHDNSIYGGWYEHSFKNIILDSFYEF